MENGDLVRGKNRKRVGSAIKDRLRQHESGRPAHIKGSRGTYVKVCRKKGKGRVNGKDEEAEKEVIKRLFWGDKMQTRNRAASKTRN